MTSSARPQHGGSESPSTDQLVYAGRTVVDHFNISFSTSQLLRLAIHFKRQAPRADMYLFFEYLASKIHLSETQKRTALRDPDIARVIVYADPTGETAVNRVVHGRGF